ncbi:hypothetical protein ACFRQM_40070 [Streptomyces sp. NPDC056831]|uniref:hypothetical protein n=1 Tax=Streptomyces sp. NPDC056831 TaxID=3345954 RepID=UPI00368E88A6
MSSPRLSLRFIRQGKPTGRYTDSRYRIEDLEDVDAAEIREGKAAMLEIRLIRKDARKSLPKVIETVFNRVGTPDAVGSYSHPEQIVDFHLRLAATDMWAAEFEELVGNSVRFRGRPYQVLRLEADDRGYSERGHLTGYAICQRTDHAPSGHPCNPKRLPLHELKQAPRQTGQSVSKENQS